MKPVQFHRLFSIPFVFFTILIFSTCSPTESDNGNDLNHQDQLVFTAAQTVFTSGASGSWDDKHVGYSSILRDGDTLRMWYSANSYDDNLYKIGYAWSLNGTDWTRYSGNPVLFKTFTWEGIDLGQPVVIKDGNIYRMWYHGWSAVHPIIVGYATSTNGKKWSKHENPVMERGFGPGTGYQIGLWSVMKENDLLHGWYYGTDGDWLSGNGSTGYATSTDGIDWEDHGICLSYSGGDKWDADFVITPIVLKSNICYEMFYLGFAHETQRPSLGYATSEDGDSWVKHSQNPIIPYIDLVSVSGSGVSLSTALCDWPETGEYHVWYSENSVEPPARIKYIHGERVSE